MQLQDDSDNQNIALLGKIFSDVYNILLDNSDDLTDFEGVPTDTRD